MASTTAGGRGRRKQAKPQRKQGKYFLINYNFISHGLKNYYFANYGRINCCHRITRDLQQYKHVLLLTAAIFERGWGSCFVLAY